MWTYVSQRDSRQIKVSAKLDDLNSIPGIHNTEEENWLPQVVLWPVHVCCGTFAVMPMYGMDTSYWLFPVSCPTFSVCLRLYARFPFSFSLCTYKRKRWTWDVDLWYCSLPSKSLCSMPCTTNGGWGLKGYCMSVTEQFLFSWKKEKKKITLKIQPLSPNTESMNQIRRYMTIVKKFAER